MHRYEAIDCATDSFKTLAEVPTGENLGDLKFDRSIIEEFKKWRLSKKILSRARY